MQTLIDRRFVFLEICLALLIASNMQCQILIGGTQTTPVKKGGGCSLNAAAAGGMRPVILPPEMVVRQDQYSALQTILGYLDHFFSVNPKIFFFNDANSPNAFATPDVMDPHFPDGTVMMGAQLINSEAQHTGPVNFTVSVIMAHEFTHILQFKLGENLPTKQAELEADYMAGWYMANTTGMWLGVASSQALQSFFSKGDYAFNSPTHHGTPEERVAAVVAGAKDARSSLKQAFSHANRYVVDE